MRQFLSKKTTNQRYKFLRLIILFVCFVLIVSVGSMSLFGMQQDGAGLQISYPFEDAGYSSIAVEADEDIHVVWHDNISGTYQLYYNRISGDLFQIWQTAKQVTESPGDAMYPSIAMDAQGNIHVVWQDNRYGHWDIYYIKLDNTGYSLISDERVTDDPSDSMRPEISIDISGDVHITWYDNRNGDYDIFWDKRIEPELTLVNLTLTPEHPMHEGATNIVVTLQNNGNNSASDVDVEFFANGISQEIKTVTFEAMSDQNISFEWIAEYGIHELKIQIDSENFIAESNENNNIAAKYVRVCQSTVFNNPEIWANATIKHCVDIDVTIEETLDPNANGTLNNISKFVEFTDDSYFDNAIIRIGYDEELLGGIDETTLLMYYWDTYDNEGERWVQVEDSGVNVEDNYVWANVSHFTVFAPLGIPPLILEGDCYYQNMSSVVPVEVEVINLDSGHRWDATTEDNHYSQLLYPYVDINESETLRLIARDDNESVNVTDYVVTPEDIATGSIQLDLILDIHYRDLKDYPWYQETVDSGAAVMKMMMDYLMWNSTTHPGGPPDVYSEQDFYDTYSGGDYIDGDEIWQGLNTEIDDHGNGWIYGYFFNPAHDISADEVLKRICIWLDYPVDYYNDIREVDVPKPGHPNHVPIAIPAYSDYSNWMTVRGIHTDQNCWPPSEIVDLNVYGFWLNDPASGGVGENTYVTVERFLDTYFFQLDVPGDRYDGEYLAITDPPRGIDVDMGNYEIKLAETVAELSPMQKGLLRYVQVGRTPNLLKEYVYNIIIDAAFKQANDILKNDFKFGELFEHAKVTGKPVFKDSEYKVTFRNSGITFDVILNKGIDLLEIRICEQSLANAVSN